MNLYALCCPYNTEARGEKIAPQAFQRTLASDKSDVRIFVDHIKSKLLARQSNATLQLFDREDGLYAKIALPSTQLGRDIGAMAESGLLSGCSVGFTLPNNREAPSKVHYRNTGGDNLTVIDHAELLEVSIITGGEPWYPTWVKVDKDNSNRSLHLKLSYLRML